MWVGEDPQIQQLSPSSFFVFSFVDFLKWGSELDIVDLLEDDHGGQVALGAFPLAR